MTLGAAPAGQASSQQTWTAPPPPSYANPGLSENTASALCYILGFITGIIFLVLAPYNTNRRVRFNAWQSIFLNVAALIIDWGLSIILHGILHLWVLGGVLMGLVHIFWLVVWIYMLVTTFNGRTTRLPIIGDLAEKQAGNVRL
jgi:uncharacterized membrane protein